MDWEKVTVVFLDMDGTLLDLHFDNYFWHEHVPLRYSELHKIDFQKAKQRLIKNYANKAGTLDWYCTDYWSKKLKLDIPALKKEISHRIKIFTHVKNFLEKLNGLNKRVVMVTNRHRDSVDLKIQHLQIESNFDLIISSHDFGYPKEDLMFWNKLSKAESYDVSSLKAGLYLVLIEYENGRVETRKIEKR